MNTRTTNTNSASRLRLPARANKVCLISRRKRSGLGRHYGARVGRAVFELQKLEGVRRLRIEEFARGQSVTVEREVRGESARAALIRLRATPGHFSRYRFLDGNCEHFARYVVDGLRKSDQISALLAACVLGVLLFALKR